MKKKSPVFFWGGGSARGRKQLIGAILRRYERAWQALLFARIEPEALKRSPVISNAKCVSTLRLLIALPARNTDRCSPL
jgi:hypothetical protein